MVLESLIECHTSLEEEHRRDSGLSPSPTKKGAADKVRAQLYEWRRNNAKRADLFGLIQEDSTKSLHQFIHESTKFQETTDKIHALIRTQQRAKIRTSGFPTNLQTQQ